MKKILTAALCAASLAFGLTGVAHADQTKLVVLKLPTAAGNYTASGTFSDTFASATEFVDDYIYTNLPAFSTDEFKVTGTGVSFEFVWLYSFPDASVVPNIDGPSTTSSFDFTTTDPLPSALWVLEIYGSAAAGSSYGGTIFSTAIDTPAAPSIPEPTSALLLLAGLGLVASRAKRARQGATVA